MLLWGDFNDTVNLEDLKKKRAFPKKLVLADAGIKDGSRIFQLVDDFVFNSSYGKIVTKRGFYTDGYSIPRFLWSIANPYMEGMESSVIHDFLYSKNCPYNYTRKEADLIFLEGMGLCGVPFVKKYAVYNAVKCFGWMFYKKR